VSTFLATARGALGTSEPAASTAADLTARTGMHFYCIAVQPTPTTTRQTTPSHHTHTKRDKERRR
jgi:hypothetical protein